MVLIRVHDERFDLHNEREWLSVYMAGGERNDADTHIQGLASVVFAEEGIDLYHWKL